MYRILRNRKENYTGFKKKKKRQIANYYPEASAAGQRTAIEPKRLFVRQNQRLYELISVFGETELDYYSFHVLEPKPEAATKRLIEEGCSYMTRKGRTMGSFSFFSPTLMKLLSSFL